MKELELLKKYEEWFNTAINYDYISALWDGDFKILIPIYEKWIGKKEKINTKCGSCRLDFMKQLGKVYFKKLEEYEKENAGRDKESAVTQTEKCNSGRESKPSCKNVGKRKGKQGNKKDS